MSQCTNNNYGSDDWSNLPLHTVLWEWLVKNIRVPGEMSTLVAYCGVLLLAWFSIVWTIRCIMSIVWPLFLLISGLVIFKFIQFYEPDEIASLVFNTLSIAADVVLAIAVKIIEGLSIFFSWVIN